MFTFIDFDTDIIVSETKLNTVSVNKINVLFKNEGYTMSEENVNELSKEPINYFKTFIEDNTAPEQLITMIHHDSYDKGCNIIRVIIEKASEDEIQTIDLDTTKHKNISSYASRTVSDITSWQRNLFINCMQKPEVFFSINDFRGYRRVTDNCHKINCIYIDIDGHSIPDDIRDIVINRAQEILNKAWNGGKLLRPSGITHSGRGLGLFYVLDRSIANISTTKKLQRFFDFVYTLLMKTYGDILKDTGLEIDTCVTDRTRIVRMPGSYNYKARRTCKLYDTDPVYYSLSEIFDGCCLQDYVMPREEYQLLKYGSQKSTYINDGKCRNSIKRKATPETLKVHYSAKQLNENRIKFYELYIAYKQTYGGLIGHREICLFLYYNALVQIMDRAKAKETIIAVNNNLQYPIEIKRLHENVFRAVDTVKNVRDEHGFYVITNEQITNKLGLSYTEANNLGLNSNENARIVAKRETANNRGKIKEIVKSIVTNNLNLKRKDWLILINDCITRLRITRRNGNLWTISLDTMDMMIKEMGLNQPWTLAYADTKRVQVNELRKNETINMNNIKRKDDKVMSSEKIVSEYCFVPEYSKDIKIDTDNTLELFNKVREIYNTRLGLPDGRDELEATHNKLFDKFISYYQISIGNKSFIDKKEKALRYICMYYLTHVEDAFFNLFIHDLNTLYGALSIGKVNISIHLKHVPVRIWVNNIPWEPTEIKKNIHKPVIVQKERNKYIPWSQLQNWQKQMVKYADYTNIFENWINKKEYTKAYNNIKELAEIDKSVAQVLCTIIYARKDKRLIRFFEELSLNTMNCGLTIDHFKSTLEKIYKKSIENIRFEPIKNHQTPENKALYRNSQNVWQWLKNGNDDYYFIKKFFKDINFKYKNNLDGIYIFNRTEYTAEVLKKKILYRLTIDDLKATNITMSEHDIIAGWIDIVTMRYPQLVLPTVA